MVLLKEKHKDRLIGGLITVGLAVLLLWGKSCLKPEDKPTNQSSKNVSTVNQLKDSAVQDNQIIKQQIDTAGIVNNDFSHNKQSTTNYYYPRKELNKKQKDTTIVNNGFLNQGGTDNTYNQTLNQGKQQRHVSPNDDAYFYKRIPSNYKVIVMSVVSDTEGEIYAKEIFARLKELAFDAEYLGEGIWPGMQRNRVYFTNTDSTKTIYVVVSPQ